MTVLSKQQSELRNPRCAPHALARKLPVALLAAALALSVPSLPAADWPEWRGAGRRGVWTETGILDRFPAGGLELSWRMPIGAGYAGPAVADGRVFVTEFVSRQGRRGVERVVCLDEQTGKVHWKHEWPVDYAGLQYDVGPRATPTVDGDRVYVLGALGHLFCLNAQTGEVLWTKNYREDYNATLPTWGMVGAPLVDGGQLICLVGGDPDAKVVSFDKMTGEELWRSLSSDVEPGYIAPVILEAGGTRQLILWHPAALTALDPKTGKVYWDHPFKIGYGLTVATPVWDTNRLLVSAFYNGSRMFRLDSQKPAADLVWRGMSDSEIETDGLHSLVTTPVLDGDYLYGIGSYGQLRCLDARTGKRVWETMEVTLENARWASAQIVRHGDRYFINNDRGDLILARLTPKGYEEIDRTRLIEPTSPTQRRRELNAVHWSHPAYANRHILTRNDKEIVRYSLAKQE
jgi:outer membrane protein assembly factor BamB